MVILSRTQNKFTNEELTSRGKKSLDHEPGSAFFIFTSTFVPAIVAVVCLTSII